MPDVFAPPGNVDGFSDTQRAVWSELVDHWLSSKIAELQADGGDPVGFFNERLEPVPGDATEAVIDWDAFPLTLRVRFDTDQARQESARLLSIASNYGLQELFENVDGSPRPIQLSYRNQDEYCEWRSEVDPASGQLSRISFTSEGPEYWELIASGSDAFVETDDQGNETWRPATPVAADPAALVDLYRRLVGPQVQPADLFFGHDIVAQSDGQWVRVFAKGAYNPYNRWNTTDGVVHLTHPASALRAAVILAAEAAVLRSNSRGEPVTGATQLICCSAFGEPNRSADPTIGATVNSLVRQGLSVTMRDPIGVYIKAINYGAFEGPNGEDGTAFWRVGRGQEGMIVRAELSVPEGAAYSLSDVLVAGEPLRSGAQVAEQIRMTLYGRAYDFGHGPPTAKPCAFHCCTSQVNRNVLQVLDAGTGCETLNQKDETWEESFPELPPAPRSALAPAHLGELSPLPRRPARRGRLV